MEQNLTNAVNDTELGKRFACGGEFELEEVIDIYGEKLLRYATSVLCNFHDAEDVIQQVFLLAYKSRSSFDGENLTAWLYKITYNNCMNKLKKRKLIFFRDVKNIKEETVNPFEQASPSDDFLKALSKLSPQDRALVYGRIMDAQSYEELGAMLGKTPAALRKQYERAKKKLAGYLKPKLTLLEENRTPVKVFPKKETNLLEGGYKNEYKFEQV